MDTRTTEYASTLSKLIQKETISEENMVDRTKFYEFVNLLKQVFPNLFNACELVDFNGSFILKLKGKSSKNPIMLMNHYDVVKASGNWKYPPFSATIDKDKIWGRGTLDNKGGLWAMLQASEELVSGGFIPKTDTYFVSTCMEECDGSGAESISKFLQENDLKFGMVLDEGGMIVEEPMDGVKGAFAMIGVGEKGCADLKFIARSSGGHASTPGKNTPLVRLAKFMVAVEKKNLFKAKMPATICETFKRLSTCMGGFYKFIFKNVKLLKPLLIKIMPKMSTTANAMLKTTVAFTMAKASDGSNVLPQEAYVIANMRYSHHQGKEDSINAIKKLADKYNVETVVLDGGNPSSITDYNGKPFKFVEKAINKVYPNVKTSPYIMTGASDSRYMQSFSEHCIRFTPFYITNEQLDSIHAVNENLDLKCLAPAVDFYKYVLTEYDNGEN